MNRRITGTLLGFAMGFFLLHPVSMAIQGLVHPVEGIEFHRVLNAFNIHHLPMAFFFGLLGALFGFLNIHYTLSLTKEKKRVTMLETLLPICSYCKKIRDDSGDEAKWHQVEHYITMKTDTTFTHGMCPECYSRIMEEIDAEDEEDVAIAHASAHGRVNVGQEEVKEIICSY